MDCQKYMLYKFADEQLESSHAKRQVTDKQIKELSSAFVKYRKSLVMNLIGKSFGGNVNSLTNVNVLLGFSETQIEQVIKNCNEFFFFGRCIKGS